MPRFNEKSLARLAEGLRETGAIGADHFRRAIEAVRRFRAIAEAMGVSRIDAVATEAMRRASNGPNARGGDRGGGGPESAYPQRG